METHLWKPAWYVIHTRSRFESVVYDGLTRKAVDTFLPKIPQRSKRRDRRVILSIPLFPGYVFVRSDLHPERHLEILKTVGVVRLIGNKNGPVPVPDDTIESLRIMVNAEGNIETGTRFHPGDRVIVVRGPFAGVIGFFSSYRGGGRVVVHIEALGQFASVEVDEEDVDLLPPVRGDR
ncbi:MAG: transcription termination/antitermination protein NusG [Desulfobacterales bacterium]